MGDDGIATNLALEQISEKMDKVLEALARLQGTHAAIESSIGSMSSVLEGLRKEEND